MDTTIVPAADAPKPSNETKAERHEFVFTGEHLVVNNGGSAKGMTAVVKRKNGRDVQFVTVNRGNGNSQSLTHHPIFTNAAGEEHIHHKGQFRKVSHLGLNAVRREKANRG